MATGMTKLANVVNPQVMSDMISAGLPKAIKFTQFARFDNTLTAQAGDTITIPSWNYIGDATDVSEGAKIDLTQMAHGTKQVKIKKAAKGIEITDEAVLSGYGDPIGEANHQLQLAIAAKIDEDIVAALGTTTLTIDKQSENISYNGVLDGVDRFEEEDDTEKFLFVHPEQITTLRKDANFIDKSKYGNDVMMNGEIGMIAGCRVVRSRRIPIDGGNKYHNFIVCQTAESEDGSPVMPAVTVYGKREAFVEADRDIVSKTTVITADQHYGVGLTNESKVVKITFKKGA